MEVVGVGRFELPASCSQIWKSGVSGCVGLCRFVLERIYLAGVMGAQTSTERTCRHSPVLPGLIHSRYIGSVCENVESADGVRDSDRPNQDKPSIPPTGHHTFEPQRTPSSTFQIEGQNVDAAIGCDDRVDDDERNHEPVRDQHPNISDILTSSTGKVTAR